VRRKRPALRTWAAVAVPAALAAVLALWNLGRPSMYGTEAVTLWAAHLPLSSLAHLLVHVDVVHGLYYLLMHVVLAAGGGTLALRLPSALGIVVAVAVTALLARRLTGSDRAALFAGLALAVLPLSSAYAQKGRSYAIDIAAAVITWYLFARAVEADDRRRWRAYAIGVAVTAYLHEMTLLLLAAHGVTLLWCSAERAVLRRWARASGVAVLAALPVLVLSLAQSGQVGWIARAQWGDVWSLYRALLGPHTLVLTVNLVLVALVLVPVVVHRPAVLTVPALAGPLLIVPPVVLIVESIVAVPLYAGTRYVIWCLPAAALLIGHGLDRLLPSGGGVRRWGPMVLGCGVLVAQLWTQWPLIARQHTARGAPQDMLAVARYVRAHARPGDGVVYAPRSFESAALGYPDDFADVRDLVLAVPGARSGTLYGTELPAPAITRAVVGTARVWLIGTSSPGGSTRPELAALAAHFRPVSRRHERGCTITLYERVSPGSG
jgi:mannosyltransferase